MKKILIFFFIIFLSINNILAEDYDTTPLTLQNFNLEFNYNDLNHLNMTNFNFEFDYSTLNLDLTLQNFNFEFEYIKATFIFNLSEIKSDYFKYKKLTELYPQLTSLKSTNEFWRELALLENDNYYNEPYLPYFKFKRLDNKYK